MPSHRTVSLALWIGILLLAPASSSADADKSKGHKSIVDKAPAPTLAVVHLAEGLRTMVPGRDMARLPETSIYKLAKAVDLDLYTTHHSILAHRFTGDRLFFVFYKTLEDAYRPQAWAFQRIKKTVREWTDAKSPAKETVTYQVEVFKVRGGQLKRWDQHHGSFGLRAWHKREIIKEYEIGYGRVVGKAEGQAWPFKKGRLYENIHPYDEDPSTYNAAQFTSSCQWTLHVSLSKDGTYSIKAPELGIDAPAQLPSRESGVPQPDPQAPVVVLTAGGGAAGAKIGTDEAARSKALGAPVAVHPYDNGQSMSFYAPHLIVKVGTDGKTTLLYTLSGFRGETAKGIGLGARRDEVLTAYGKPAKSKPGALNWNYSGVIFFFDSFDCVRRIAIIAKKK